MRWVAILLSAAVGQAACLPVAGDHILGSDLAAADPAFQALPAEQVISFAPAPGTQRSLSARELERIAKRFDIPDAGTAPFAPLCFERSLESIEPARMLAAMAAALGIPEEQIRITDFSRFRVPAGRVDFPRSGLASPPANAPDAAVFWRGRVIYDHGRSMPIWAKVQVRVETTVVTAAVNIGAGQIILPEQLSVAVKKQFPFAQNFSTSPEQIAGKRARRSILAGAPLQANLVEAPREIAPGDLVQVSASNGEAQISFEAHAQSGGRKGEAILVRNPSNGRSFRAIVMDKGKVEVRPSGA